MRRSTGVVLAIVVVTGVVVAGPLWTEGADEGFQFTVWGMPFEDRLFEDGYARDFEALHPGLEVRYARYPRVDRKYFAWHLRGTGSDVMRLTIDSYHLMATRGLLTPLDAYLDDPEIGIPVDERADFPPSVWEPLEVDGRRYCLPSDHNLYGLFWNKRVFEQHNAEHPDDPVPLPSPDWTWDTLREVSANLTVVDDSGRTTRNGIDFHLHPWPFYTFVKQAGGELWDEQGTTTLIDSRAGVEALELIIELIGNAPSVRISSTSQSATGPDKLFASERTAMLLDGSWRAPGLELANPDLDFAIATLPTGRERAVIGSSVLWCVSTHAEDPELAWEMIRWMTSREQSLRYWDTLRVAPPARLSVIASPAFRQTAGLVDADGEIVSPPMPASRFEDRGRWLLHGLVEAPDGGPAPAFIGLGPYHRDLNTAVHRMLVRAVSPSRTESLEQLLDDAAVQVHGIIDRDRASRGLPPIERN